MKKNKAITLSFILIMVLLLGIVSVSGMSVSEIDPDNKYKYEEMVIPKALPVDDGEEPNWEILYYRESYEYYSCEDASTNDEATPDFVLIYLKSNMASPLPDVDVLGDYVFYSLDIAYPFAYGYGVFIPKTGEVYDLIKAYDMKIEGIENVFTEAGVGRLIGDMDEDRKLTVKDATYIQKCLAELSGFTESFFAAMPEEGEPCAISDFNRDGKRDIRDATAIQKHIAGLPY